MTDYRNRIASHVQGDEWRHYEFTRDSKIPHGTFGKRRSVDTYVFAACVVLLILGMIAVNL